MESATPKLSTACLPHDKRDRPVGPGRPVFELLELWGKGEEGTGERKDCCRYARDLADGVDIMI